jgi:Ca2+-binding RTX toxin-like protein
VDATAGGVSIVDGDFAITEVGANDAAGGGLTISGTADATITTASLINSGLYLTTANDVAITTLDTAVVAGGGTGNYDLGTVASSAAATVQITTGAGDDTMTLDSNGGDDKFLVNTGDGADTVTANETETGTVINLGAGDDTFAPVAGGNFVGTAALGGDGGDTLSLDDGGDYSAMAPVTGVDIISLEGTTAVTISLDQLTTDDTFEVQGSSGTITIGGTNGADTIDLSNVTHKAGNQTGFQLSGGTGNDTITGAARDDVITGGAGADVLTGNGGADQFTYTALSEGGDTIVDFDSGADTIAFSSGAFSLGTGNGAAAINTITGVTGGMVFSGADLATWLANNTTHNSLGSGTYKIMFIDTSGTDAGVYHVTGTVTVGLVATASSTVTVALTGNAAVAETDLIVI